MSSDADQPRERQISRDEETIRSWADEHDAVPVRTTGTGGQEQFGLVPESEADDAQRVEWDAFFEAVESADRVVVYRGDDASRPLEVTGHDEVVTDDEIEERLLEGETVTTEITETTVVESVVVEEITVDTELVDTELVDYEVIDVELLDRSLSNLEVVEEAGAASRDWFDVDRYAAGIGDRLARRQASRSPSMEGETTMEEESTLADEPTSMEAESAEMESTTMEPTEIDREVPYYAAFDVEERWAVTVDLVERYEVESRISDADVTEADTIEDHEVDVGGLHRSIVESGIIETGEDRPTEEVVADYDMESDLAGSDRITTSFTRDRTVEEEVQERKHMEADVSMAELVSMDVLGTRTIEAVGVEEEAAAETAVTDVDTETEAAAVETEPEAAAVEAEPDATARSDVEAEAVATDPSTLDDDDLGKTVVDASGTEVGIVADVHDDGQTIAVDTSPGITDRIRTTLGWGEGTQDNYSLSTDQVEAVTDDEVRLKREEHLDETGT